MENEKKEYISMFEKPQLKEVVYEDELIHYGTPRHSGRYPWGSGDDPFQRTGDFLSRVDEIKSKGITNKTEIAKALDMSTTEFRTKYSLALEERRKIIVDKVNSLAKDGLGATAIARELGLANESTVRSILNGQRQARLKKSEETANTLKQLVKEKGNIDVGANSERQLGISREKMNSSLEILKNEGYEIYNIRVPQATNKGRYTTMKILCPPGTPYKDAYNLDKISSIDDYMSRDGGKTIEPSFRYPESLSSKRVQIVYAEDGGAKRDGLVELRRGVKDISLGGSNYAQVRIMVDGTHYIKGMAVYSDDLPEGIDVRFNTNKSKSKPMMGYNEEGKPSSDHGVLKAVKNDPDNPFGSNIKEVGGQMFYDDPKGKYVDPVTGHKQSLSVINKRADQGDWGEWSKELPSQFLSKQPYSTIKKQITISEKDKMDEYETIMSLTNPTIKKYLLNKFADDCESAAVHLKAAAFPGQKYKVILPIPSLKDDEIYNPDLMNGRQVALIRYPHAGPFEIPILTVNNKNKEARARLGETPSDAVGINSSVAGILSGADFDGDTVMCIPLSEKTRIKNQKPLEGLKGFDTGSYGADDVKTDSNGEEHYYRNGHEYRIMNNTQVQMGMISNLINDMTLKGAKTEEIARAARHSMVVIDAEKHKLDYKQSEKDNGIAELKNKYQKHVDYFTGKESKGASTLLSQAKAEIQNLPERKEGAFYRKDTGKIVEALDEKNQIYIDKDTGEIFEGRSNIGTRTVDPKTGKKLYRNTNRVYYKAKINGKSTDVYEQNGVYYYKDKDTGEYTTIDEKEVTKHLAMQTNPSVAKAAYVDDVHVLSSGTPQEELYAEYSNYLKSLGNKARKEAVYNIKDNKMSVQAKAIYSDEVKSLEYKANQAALNAPRERQAQLIANTNIKAKTQEDPSLTSEQVAKLKQKELSRARAKVGAQRTPIVITEKEWEAIQAGAISTNRLQLIMKYIDDKRLKELAMPRNSTKLSSAKITRMNSMANLGYTTSEIADILGVSASTVTKYLNGKE